MNFLDKLYSSNYFGIGLFAVIAFLVVTFLIVLFFGKKDQKKRKLEETQKLEAKDTFKETSVPTPVEIPVNPEPVAPINLETNTNENLEPVKPVVEPSIVTPVEPVIPVMPVPPINSFSEEPKEEYVDNLILEESVKPVIEEPKIEPIINTRPIINERIVEEVPQRVTLEPTKIEIPREPIHTIITEENSVNEPVAPILKEEDPKLQINEEPVINTYYKPAEKIETEKIKVPSIDFDALAKSISKELDELEKDSKKYEEITVTPMNEVTNSNNLKKPETFSSVYVREPIKEPVKEKIELPKKIDLPARKSE